MTVDLAIWFHLVSGSPARCAEVTTTTWFNSDTTGRRTLTFDNVAHVWVSILTYNKTSASKQQSRPIARYTCPRLSKTVTTILAILNPFFIFCDRFLTSRISTTGDLNWTRCGENPHLFLHRSKTILPEKFRTSFSERLHSHGVPLSIRSHRHLLSYIIKTEDFFECTHNVLENSEVCGEVMRTSQRIVQYESLHSQYGHSIFCSVFQYGRNAEELLLPSYRQWQFRLASLSVQSYLSIHGANQVAQDIVRRKRKRQRRPASVAPAGNQLFFAQ